MKTNRKRRAIAARSWSKGGWAVLLASVVLACQGKTAKPGPEPPSDAPAQPTASMTPSHGGTGASVSGATGGAVADAGAAPSAAGGTGGATASGGTPGSSGAPPAVGGRSQYAADYMHYDGGVMRQCGNFMPPVLDTTTCGDGAFCMYGGGCFAQQGPPPTPVSGICFARPADCPTQCYGRYPGETGVCGCDYRRYCNECQANLAGVDILGRDNCPEEAP